MNEKTNAELGEEISRNETRAEFGAWAVVVGLVIEVFLAIAFRSDKSFIENWAPVLADCLIALGVYCEIHFGRRVRTAAEELQRLSDEKVAEANARGREAERKTEEERLSRVKIEREIINQLKPRDFTKKQFDTIVDDIKRKIKVRLTVFVAADSETFRFGLAIGDLFREAQIDATFFQLNMSSSQVIGVGSTGMTLYAPGGASNPELRELAEAISSLTLAENGFAVGGYFGPAETPGVPIPSLFVMPKQYPFFRFPEYLAPPELSRPPWEPK